MVFGATVDAADVEIAGVSAVTLKMSTAWTYVRETVYIMRNQSALNTPHSSHECTPPPPTPHPPHTTMLKPLYNYRSNSHTKYLGHPRRSRVLDLAAMWRPTNFEPH